jgi:hypothetical protein
MTATATGLLGDPFRRHGRSSRFTGPDMGELEPLVGSPMPKTQAYDIAGKLGFAGFDRITFENFRNRIGRYAIGGSIEVQPGASQVRDDDAGKTPSRWSIWRT